MRDLFLLLFDTGRTATAFWFGLSLLYAAGCAGLALHQAFRWDYVVADDVRQHVFWMFTFIDPELFPDDLAASYFRSLAPFGYQALYGTLAWVGLDPLTSSKLLPPVLGLISAAYCFGVSMRILRSPAGAFLSSVLLDLSLWMNTDLCSATPRAFAYPLALAFLFYLTYRSRAGVLITTILQGLFFPLLTLISLGVLVMDLFRWQQRRLIFSSDRNDYLLLIFAAVAVLAVLLPYQAVSAKFGPIVELKEARDMPEFSAGGRVPFFSDNAWSYWIKGSGGLHFPSRPKFLWAAFLLPALLFFPTAFPLGRKLAAGARPLPQLVLASLGMFFAAHLLLFRLYLPSRYTQHTFRIALALAGGMAVIIIVHGIISLARRQSYGWSLAALSVAGGLVASIVFYPLFLGEFPKAGYVIGEEPELYRFFASQPKNIRIASVSDEANNLPVLSRRSILVGTECAVPFHPAYYQEIRRRELALIQAQYSEDLVSVQQFIRDEHIDFWLFEPKALTESYVRKNRLISQFEDVTEETAGRLKLGSLPALKTLIGKYSVFSNKHFIVLDANAILSASAADSTKEPK